MCVEKRQIWLKSDKNVGHFTRRHTYVLLLLLTQIRYLKHFYVTLNVFVLLTVRCSSTIDTEHIVAFPLAQRSRQDARMLRST
jgi:hypothetical protein